MKTELVCILCPQGCNLEVEFDRDQILAIAGNRCTRGPKYAAEEIFQPMRVLTTTVRVSGGIYPVIPVKSRQPIPKERIFLAMAEINRLTISAPVKLGDVLLVDLAGSGISLVATKDVAKAS